MPVEAVVALIGVGGIVVAGVIGAGAAVLSSWLTARHMQSVADTQIAAAREVERTRFVREQRERRVARLRALLGELREATASAIGQSDSNAAIDSDGTTSLIRQTFARRGEPETPDAIEDVRERIRKNMREGEVFVGDSALAIVRALSRIATEIFPEGPIREALRALHVAFSAPMIEAGKVDFGVLSLASLMIDVHEIERRVDEFVVGGEGDPE